MSINGGGGKASDKANFTQTCNLLSQFLKEKRTGLVPRPLPKAEEIETISRAPVTTMNLLTNMDNKPDLRKVVSTREAAAAAAASASAVTAAPMTIFYGGQVVVFSDFPADKAEEIMALAAGKGSSNNASNVINGSAVSESNAVTVQERHQQQQQEFHSTPAPQANASDLPIARRASLHRFLEKRKDRAVARAPYQVNLTYVAAAAAASKPGGSGSGSSFPIKPEQQQSSSEHLDLTL